MLSSSRSYVFGLACTLFFVTLLKIAINVFASPMVGYANNYDFFRASMCTGVWLYKDGQPAAPDHRSSRNELNYSGLKVSEECLRSVDNVYAHVVRQWHQKGDNIDFREIGAVKLTVLAAAVLGLIWLVRTPAVLLGLAIVFYLLFGDMSIIPYFNSFYSEFSTVAGLYFLTAACVWISVTPTHPGLRQVAVVGLYAAWLGLSKMQYALLTPVILAYCAAVWGLRWGFGRSAWSLLGLACAIPLAFMLVNPSDRGLMRSVSMANKTNTFLWAVLPAATDKQAAMEFLNIPAKCEKAIGQHWFVPGYQENNPCPEIVRASRARLALLFFQDFNIFYSPMKNAVLSAHPLYPNMLEKYEKPQDADTPVQRFMQTTSITQGINAVSRETFSFASLLLMALGLPAAIALALWGRSMPSSMRGGATMLMLGAVLCVYALASSIFGDGYADFPKHAVGMYVGLAYQCVGVLLVLHGMWQGRRLHGGQRNHGLTMNQA